MDALDCLIIVVKSRLTQNYLDLLHNSSVLKNIVVSINGKLNRA